jgi:hypothetical protein
MKRISTLMSRIKVDELQQTLEKEGNIEYNTPFPIINPMYSERNHSSAYIGASYKWKNLISV